jgi:MFS family permease
MFGGAVISLFVLVSRPATLDMLGDRTAPADLERTAAQWFAWYQCAFLLGAAAGGWLFGVLGDRYGRTRAMGWSILCYALVTGGSYFAPDPRTLWWLRFAACLGVGGVWPNAVALAVEALPRVPRPLLAGLMGTASNVGFVLLGALCLAVPATPEHWRWVLLACAPPALLGWFALYRVPESPQWLARRAADAAGPRRDQPLREIFRPPLRRRTLIGILLGGIPVIGTAANAHWLVPWSDQVHSAQAAATAAASPEAAAPRPPRGDPRQKARTQIQRSAGAVVGSLLGGWLATLAGRRTTYFLISLATLLTSTCLYGVLDPAHPWFGALAFVLGLTGVMYFGWLPLYLPELFPTRVRATGAGVTFNSGRLLAAASVLGAGVLAGWFDGDYARVGLATGLIYAFGMAVICFAPDTQAERLDDC